MLRVHGIKNCDTVKKSLKWLDKHELPYEFIDVREAPLQQQTVLTWLEQLPPEKLLNKRSTSWRQLTEAQKTESDPYAIAALVSEQPTLFKRPLVETSDGIHCGFNEKDWSARYL